MDGAERERHPWPFKGHTQLSQRGGVAASPGRPRLSHLSLGYPGRPPPSPPPPLPPLPLTLVLHGTPKVAPQHSTLHDGMPPRGVPLHHRQQIQIGPSTVSAAATKSG
ncbi:uncharacterized protein LOC144209180 [Stigmatopora nigra]